MTPFLFYFTGAGKFPDKSAGAAMAIKTREFICRVLCRAYIYEKKSQHRNRLIYIYIKVERYFRQPERKLKLFLCQQSLLRYLELF